MYMSVDAGVWCVNTCVLAIVQHMCVMCCVYVGCVNMCVVGRSVVCVCVHVAICVVYGQLCVVDVRVVSVWSMGVCGCYVVFTTVLKHKLCIFCFSGVL